MYHDPINNLWAVLKFFNKLCIFLRSKLTLIFVLANWLINSFISAFHILQIYSYKCFHIKFLFVIINSPETRLSMM